MTVIGTGTAIGDGKPSSATSSWFVETAHAAAAAIGVVVGRFWQGASTAHSETSDWAGFGRQTALQQQQQRRREKGRKRKKRREERKKRMSVEAVAEDERNEGAVKGEKGDDAATEP